MTWVHCEEPPQDQCAQTPPLPPPPPLQHWTPLTTALHVPPLLQVLGAAQVRQFPSEPVQPGSQLLGMHAECRSRAKTRAAYFIVSPGPRF